MTRAKAGTAKNKNGKLARAKPAPETYSYPDATSLLRPDVGTQAQFKKSKPPVTRRYDSSLSPVLEWDGQNSAREKGEELIARILETGVPKAKSEEPGDPEARIKALEEGLGALEGELEKAKVAARELRHQLIHPAQDRGRGASGPLHKVTSVRDQHRNLPSIQRISLASISSTPLASKKI